MNVFGYIVGHDFGFAPNPFGPALTLACCKGSIRRSAQRGDYVFGMGSASGRLEMTGRLIYWMRVTDIQPFRRYFEIPEFQCKKPTLGGGTADQMGDNIYSWDAESKSYNQHRSFHSHRDGTCNRRNYIPDTRKTDSVLISKDFCYFGGAAPELPLPLRAEFTLKGLPDMKRQFTDVGKAALVRWMTAFPHGYHGDPASWGKLKVT